MICFVKFGLEIFNWLFPQNARHIKKKNSVGIFTVISVICLK